MVTDDEAISGAGALQENGTGYFVYRLIIRTVNYHIHYVPVLEDKATFQ